MIIVVFGLPATGKSFFAKHLAEQTGARYLNTDIIRKAINKQGDYDQQSKELVYKCLLEKMTNFIRSGETEHVVVDGTFHKKEKRNLFRNKASETGQEIYFIETKASELTVKERLKKKRKYSEADYKVYVQIKSNYDQMHEDHLVLWSDAMEVNEMTNRAKKYIDEQRSDS